MDVADPTSKRILYLITKGTWGGAQRYVYELALEARARGHVSAVACGTGGELVRRLEEAGIPVILVSGLARDVRLGSDLRALTELVSLMRRERPDVVHGNSSKAGLLAMIAARLACVPRIIFTAHGWAWNELRPVWQKVVFKGLHYLTVLLAHRTIAVSEAIREEASWMRLSSRIHTIRHGVAPLPLIPRSQARTFLSETGGSIPRDAFWIGSLAELHPTKGLDTLIRAFAQVHKNHAELVLVLIGAGQDRGRLLALAHMLGIESSVHFVGHIEHAARLLPALDVFTFPSRSEALGYAALEAGQAQLPVVASRVGGIPEIITDEVTGLLVPPGNEEALATAITRMVEDPTLRNALSSALLTRVHVDFGTERMLHDTFNLYT